MNSDLQNKLQQFSANPPEGIWNKIADALDAEEGFPQRLYNYEEAPPAANWQKIEQQLDAQPKPRKAVPFGKRFSRPVHYMAAACVLAITLVTVTMTRKGTEAVAPAVSGTTTVPAANVPVTVIPSQTNDVQRSTTVSQSSDNNNSKSSAGSRSRATSGADTRSSNSSSPINTSLNDYVTYSDGNGNVVKVSRKMENYINCEDSDWQCKQRLQQLRQKMAAKAMTTDFTGILEMLRQLQ